MRRITIVLFFVLSLVMLSSVSCVKDEIDLNNITDTDWCPDGAMPLINSDLGMWDILKDYDSLDVFVVDSNSFIYLIYEDTVYSPTAEEFLALNDNTFTHSVSVNIPPVSLNEQVSFSVDLTNEFNFNDMQIDSVLFKGGQILTSFSANFNMPVKIVYSIVGATKYGQPFKDSINLQNGGNIEMPLSLDGVKFVFDDPTNNRITIKLDLTFYGNGCPVNSPYTMNVGAYFGGMKFKTMYGYFGQHSVSMGNDTVSLRLYNNAIDGTINWNDPRVYLVIYNGLGLPVRVNIDYLAAEKLLPPAQVMNITGTGIPNPWNINFPTNVGEMVKSTISLNKTNSNIAQALNLSPQKVLALVSGLCNPDGNVVKNFVSDNSRLGAEARLELPMYGSVNALTMQDTFDLDFGNVFDRIEYINFKLFTRNSFPLDGRVQLYFCDMEYNVLDSLLDTPDQFIVSATPASDEDGVTISPAEKMVTQSYETARVEKLRHARKVIVRAKVDTYDHGSTHVKLYSYYRIGVRLSARLQMKFSSRDI